VSDTNVTFGDFEDDDAFGTEPPDPEQVAVRLHELRVLVDELTGAAGLHTWNDLTDSERELAIGLGRSLVEWLLTHQPEPEEAARALHNVRRYLATTPLPPWEELPKDDKRIGIDLMTLIIDWLRRQGGVH
jgi:hypothetical protein